MPGPASLNSGVFADPGSQVASMKLGIWYLWCLCSEAYQHAFWQTRRPGTTISHLYQGTFVEFAYPVPTLVANSMRIADFLDRETAKIDTLVAKKRTLIERLKEKRTALISRTVTRGLPPDAARAAGLDPHPKLKPSGIDWLGDVPEHWDVEGNPRISRIGSGTTLRATDADYDEEDIPWVTTSELRGASSGIPQGS